MERKQSNCSHMNMPSPVLREQFERASLKLFNLLKSLGNLARGLL